MAKFLCGGGSLLDFYQKFQQCMMQNQAEQAMHYLQQHLQNNPRHAYGFFQAGNLFRSLEQWPQALNAFSEACRLDPEQSELHTSLGIIYNQMQKPESAIASFNTACEKSRIRRYVTTGRWRCCWPVATGRAGRNMSIASRCLTKRPTTNGTRHCGPGRGSLFPARRLLYIMSKGWEMTFSFADTFRA